MTPFRLRYERSRRLGPAEQLRECIEYIENSEVLIQEFLESHHRTEVSCAQEEQSLRPSSDELVLERFHESLDLWIAQGGSEDRVQCVAGAINPIADEEHPAISRRGVDFVALRGTERQRIVLGAATDPQQPSPYILLLRLLNSFAELSPPIQLERLLREILRGRVEPGVPFELLMVVDDSDSDETDHGIFELTRDLAETFKRGLGEAAGFQDVLSAIGCISRARREDGPDAKERYELSWAV